MFPESIIEILKKYQNFNGDNILSISKSINDIIIYLNKINENISIQIQSMITNKNIDSAKELFSDCETLCNFINSIKPLDITLPEHNIEIAKELTTPINDFDEQTHIHICCENICPKCVEKLDPISIYYQRKTNGVINRESVSGFRCPNCGSLYMIDSDFEKFSDDNTNIEIHTKRYNKLNIQDEVYVVTDVNKCSANNHDLEDILGTIPIINKEGKVAFTYVDIIHCKTCHKYIMLKNTYQRINNFLACQVIDETKEQFAKTYNSISNYDTTGSKLSQLGYNVNCVDKLTENQRETLLAAIITSGLLTQGEIIGNIDKNIANGRSRIGSKKDWSNAVEKWEHDKKFVQSFKIEQSDNDINIGKIILKYRKSKIQ